MYLYRGETKKIEYQPLNIPTFYLRDIDSAKNIAKNLQEIQNSLAIIGSGGIAFDLVYEFKKNASVKKLVWFYNPEKTSEKYFDKLAMAFLLDDDTESETKVNRKLETDKPHNEITLSTDTTKSCSVFTRSPEELQAQGSKMSLGGTNWKGLIYKNSKQSSSCQLILVEQEVTQQLLDQYECEMACVAIGVEQVGCDLLKGNKNENSLLTVDINMRVSAESEIYAAGDCCTLNWPTSECPYFFQMQLWSQAKLLGSWAATCMMQNQHFLDFAFNTFAHVSNFFGYRIIYLGLYRENGADCKFLYRVTKFEEYVKVIVRNNRVIGAVLIGDTENEEVFENLIQNELDIGMLEDDLLNPDIDLDHYFD